MGELAKDNDRAALDLLFTGVRRYPLLTAQDEQAADLKKWQALEEMCMGSGNTGQPADFGRLRDT